MNKQDTVAFFDLDYTLLDTSSGMVYLIEILKKRRVPLWSLAQISVRYQLKQLDFGQTHAQLILHVGKHGQQKAQQFFDSWVLPRLLPRLTTAGQEKIAWHRQQGHRVVINSASIKEIVAPIAEHLNLDYLCTHLAIQNNRYTGQLSGPLCYGPGKVHWAKQWAQANQLAFPQCVGYFYTDSSSDLPLLELADQPVAVNPSRKLAKIAAARGWPVERFY